MYVRVISQKRVSVLYLITINPGTIIRQFTSDFVQRHINVELILKCRVKCMCPVAVQQTQGKRAVTLHLLYSNRI